MTNISLSLTSTYTVGPYFISPTNAPTDGAFLVASGIGGSTKYASAITSVDIGTLNSTNLNMQGALLTTNNAGTAGQTLTSGGAGVPPYWQTGSSGQTIASWRQGFAGFDDFLGPIGVTYGQGPLSFVNTVNGGTTIQLTGETNAPGIIELSTSTSGNASPTIGQFFGDKPYKMIGTYAACYTNEWRVRIPTLPTAAESFNVRTGFSSVQNSNAVLNGAYFLVNTNDSHFVAVLTAANGSLYATNSTVVEANVWYDLNIVVVTNSGATGLSATFTVNGTDAVTVTNIGFSGTVALFSQICKDQGTTARTLDHDYCYLAYKLPSSR